MGGRGTRWWGGLVLLLGGLLLGLLSPGAAQQTSRRGKKVVFIAGTKSHGPGDHEYEKGCRLLARALQTSPNAGPFRTEVHLYGWPEDPRTLDDADAIVLYCDGSDHSEADHPLLTGDRLQQLARQMKRGCGLVALHYTVFVPGKRGGPEFLDWLGGYFDYETGIAANHWFSKIQTAAATPTLAAPGHPVARGLSAFPLRDEYYYNIRFPEGDRRRTPILNVSLPNEPDAQTVAWTVQRADGGRGFAYTGGHFHANWQVENLRKMVLNAIVWTAHGQVPEGGVASTAPTDDPIRALIVTGHHHPAHDWKTTTPALRDDLTGDPRLRVSVIENPEELGMRDLSAYDLIVQNYQNWESPTLGTAAREKLLRFVEGGGGLIVVHFANGAWRDWPEYRRLSRRMWIDPISAHDAYGPFRVNIPHPHHLLTRGLQPFDTTDELYYHQVGADPIDPLLTARSKNTGHDEPLAFTYMAGKGRVFQLLLGHDAAALRNPPVAEVLRRAAAWVADREVLPQKVEVRPASRLAPGKWGQALDARAGAVAAAGKAVYQNPPLTVECWAKLNGKSGFNVLVANSAKESPRHWELYTMAGSGNLAAFIPGLSPANIESKTNVVDGQWHYLAMTYLPGEIRLFVDGRQAARETVSFTNAGPIVGPLWIGGYPPQGIGCDGLVDDVRVSRTIRAFNGMPQAPASVDEETIGLWRLDAEEGGAFADLSAQGNPARVGGVAAAAPAPALSPESTPNPAPFPTVRKRDSVDWPFVGNDPGGMRYSRLTQLNRDNVSQLQVAWEYHGGDAAGTTIECTPVVVDGVMYVTTAKIHIVALDAATGKEIWRYDPHVGGVNRGVAYWSDGKPNGARRILAALTDGRVLSLDAHTGKLDPHFGKGGVVQLRDGMERDLRQLNYGCTSAPVIFEDRVIVPIINSEGQPGAPGDIRAFDVRSGREVWRFHTVPQPYEFGNETWVGDSWKERSGANAWSGYTVDARRGIVYCGLGSAASDFYGGDRHGANLFANCTLALDARTGKRLWHFQTLHHDLWDHDLPCPPTLVQVRKDGRLRDAVAQPTKTGYLFLFDRVTGKPIYPVEERPVPASDVPGEQASPTQPFPVQPPPFSHQYVGVGELTNISPEANAYARELFSKLKGGPAFTPPSLQGTVTIPGFHGGANWSGASFDPETGLLYLNSNNVPNVTTLIKQGDGYNHTGYFRFLDKDGYPAIKPPWGNLNAIDLGRGDFAWQIVFGEYPELTKRGVPPTGTENFGGTIVTKGGLVFIGGTKDEQFHAYDKTSGKLLWQTTLPAGGYATPCTYMVNGRQYVVIAAGGGGKLGTKSGDSFVAFALPKRN